MDGVDWITALKSGAIAGLIDDNTLQPEGAKPGEAIFMLTTNPNAKQQQALDLIAAITV